MADLANRAALVTDINNKVKYNPDIPHDSSKTSGDQDRANRINIYDTALAEVDRLTKATGTTITTAAVTLPNANTFYAVNISTNVTQTLATVGISDGVVFEFKRIDSTANTFTVEGLGSDPFISPATSINLLPGEALRVRKINGNWYIL